MADEYITFNNNTQPALNDTNVNRMQQLIKQDIRGAVSGDTLPIGAIMPFGSDTIPENWLLCNGQAVSRTDYADLFNTIGITFGQGDGFTTFNLPNLKGKVVVGKDENDTDFDVLGETGGEKEHTLTIDEMPEHSHTFKDGLKLEVSSGNIYAVPDYTIKTGQTLSTSKTGFSQPHNILQPYQVQNYIIKARQSAGVVATVVDNLNSTSTTDALSANQGNILNERFNYSTAEKQVGYWVNGKPLYQITLIGTKVSESDLEIPIPANIDKICSVEGRLKALSGTSYSLDRTEGENYTRTEVSTSSNLFKMKSSGIESYFSGEVVATLRYTKTTD